MQVGVPQYAAPNYPTQVAPPAAQPVGNISPQIQALRDRMIQNGTLAGVPQATGVQPMQGTAQTTAPMQQQQTPLTNAQQAILNYVQQHGNVGGLGAVNPAQAQTQANNGLANTFQTMQNQMPAAQPAQGTAMTTAPQQRQMPTQQPVAPTAAMQGAPTGGLSQGAQGLARYYQMR